MRDSRTDRGVLRRAGRFAACLVFTCGGRLAAQVIDRLPPPSAADIAISQGRLGEAESLLFAASARATHEPSARGALGSFLASRGRFRIGAVLLEEARQFGGDAKVINVRLAHIYAWLGDWAAIAALPSAPGSAEHDRARWLTEHAPRATGRDSASVALEPNEVAGLGRIALTIGRATIVADIDPRVEGLVLPLTTDVTAEAELFGMRDGSTIGAIRTVGIGVMRLTNVRAALSQNARAAVGLDVLAAMTPTFDAGAHVLTLHSEAISASGDPLPILLGFPGIRFFPRAMQPAVAMESAAGRAALRGARWTFDAKHGSIMVMR